MTRVNPKRIYLWSTSDRMVGHLHVLSPPCRPKKCRSDTGANQRSSAEGNTGAGDNALIKRADRSRNSETQNNPAPERSSAPLRSLCAVRIAPASRQIIIGRDQRADERPTDERRESREEPREMSSEMQNGRNCASRYRVDKPCIFHVAQR